MAVVVVIFLSQLTQITVPIVRCPLLGANQIVALKTLKQSFSFAVIGHRRLGIFRR